jgi:hypothetical protein
MQRSCPHRRFTKYGQGCLWADDCADGAAGAAVLNQLNRMEAFGRQALHIKRQHLLRAFSDAQLATFAVHLIDFNPTAYGHARFSPFSTVMSALRERFAARVAPKYTLSYLIIPPLNGFD